MVYKLNTGHKKRAYFLLFFLFFIDTIRSDFKNVKLSSLHLLNIESLIFKLFGIKTSAESSVGESSIVYSFPLVALRITKYILSLLNLFP